MPLSWPFPRRGFAACERAFIEAAEARFARASTTLDAARREYGEALLAGDAALIVRQAEVLEEASRRFEVARHVLERLQGVVAELTEQKAEMRGLSRFAGLAGLVH
jgi:hypothetical protein